MSETKSATEIELGPDQLAALDKRLTALEKKVRAKPQSDVVKLYLDGGDDSCMPTPDGSHGFDLKFSSDSPEPAIPPRMAFPLNCGFSVELPKGMRVAVQVTTEWAQKGLILTTNSYDENVSRTQVSVMAYNVGKQILAFQHGEVIGKVWFVKSDQVAIVVSE